MREIIFVIVAVAFLGVLVWLSYKSKQKRFPTMFAVALFCLLALYLFRYGNLSSFSLKALSAEASFIREKREEVVEDAEAVSTIKSQVQNLLTDSQASKREIEQTKTEILALKKQLEETSALASPPTLQLTRDDIQTVESGYKITLQFTPSKNEPLGSIVFVATIDDDSETRILDFWPSIEGGVFASGDDSKKIQDDGKQARLSYSLMSGGKPTFDLTVSGKARIKIQGNCLKDALAIFVPNSPSDSGAF